MTVPPGGGAPPWPPEFVPVVSNPSNRRRWLVLGVAVLAVIALVVGLLVWKGASTSSNSGSGGPTSTADDGTDRTVGLLREKDPVCDDWRRYSDELAAKEERWASSNRGIPANKWTPEQREIFISIGEAMSVAADQFESILPKARNVVIQELIAQTIVHLRAYVDRIPNYVDSDGLVAGVATNFSNGVTYMCSAVPLVPSDDGDIKGSSIVPKPSALAPFMASKDPICDDFLALIERQDTLLSGWTATDATIPAAQWSADQRKLNNAAREVLIRDLADFREIAERAEGRIVGDVLTAQNAYMQAYADSIPTYTPDDNQLWRTVLALGGGVGAACKAKQ